METIVTYETDEKVSIVTLNHPARTEDGEPSVLRMNVPPAGMEYEKVGPTVPSTGRTLSGDPASSEIEIVPVSGAPEVFERITVVV